MVPTLVVSRQWLEDAMTVSVEMAWTLSVLMDNLDDAPEDVLDVLQNIHKACEDQRQDIANKLGVQFPTEPPPQPKQLPSYLRLVVPEETTS